MKRYEFWDYITEGGREAALRERYTHPCATHADDTENTRTPEGLCPVGAALRAMGLEVGGAPDPAEAAEALALREGADVDESALIELATEFTTDWDEGRIGADRLPEAVRNALLQTDEPIGRVLQTNRVETFREILRCWRAPAGRYGAHFGGDATTSTISRCYRLWAGGRPIMLITERFPSTNFVTF
jgi:hypothetical protein